MQTEATGSQGEGGRAHLALEVEDGHERAAGHLGGVRRDLRDNDDSEEEERGREGKSSTGILGRAGVRCCYCTELRRTRLLGWRARSGSSRFEPDTRRCRAPHPTASTRRTRAMSLQPVSLHWTEMQQYTALRQARPVYLFASASSTVPFRFPSGASGLRFASRHWSRPCDSIQMWCSSACT